ncbi:MULTISPECIES: hypothetical protein [unclassified Marinitoga]|uniref:hypothetical protein n=1 Tax=unclassified Marinitoga TaxID=2640159 RepID=UPI000640EC68|nr:MULTISPECIES: hypothetical protein [unclassified Marinitoga]KLO24676.1 hypothetical protein X274_02855 [Marinitoga sp. 1155]NUU98857.1 hypothetical protein [Marinitoga sp. 1154]
MKNKYIILFFIVFFSLNLFSIELNFSHLEFLRDTFKINDKNVVGYWIYADKYGQKYVHKEAIGEGVTCVDDVARVAILYTDLYKTNKNDFYYQRAKEALNFVISMQDFDGDFYNFILKNGNINKYGITSKKSGSWWAARAFWALSNAINVFPDDLFNKKLINSAKKAKSFLLKKLDSNYLLNKSSDVSSIFLLGLSAYYNQYPNNSDLNYIINIADSILKTQISNGPFSGSYNESSDNNRYLWHTWGSRQGEALIEVYKITKNIKYLNSVKKYVDFYDLLLSIGPVYEIKDYIKKYPYLSYGLETIISTLSKLYLVTKEDIYAVKAFLFGSFYNGNNHLNSPFTGKNGEGFDGMHSVYINQNAGAESTVSYLISLERLNELPKTFEKFYFSKTIDNGNSLLLEAEKMDYGIYSFELENTNNIQIKTNEKIALKTYINISGNYYIYLIGKIPDSKIKIYSGKNKIIVNNKIFIPIELEKGKLTISITPKETLYLDQILIIPKKFKFVVKVKNEFFEILNNEYRIISYNGDDISYKKDLLNIKIDFIKKDNYYIANLDNIFNNNGIVEFSERKEGNFDNPDGVFGAKYPAEEIEKYLSNNILKYNNILFKIKIQGLDNLIAVGQKLELKNIIGNTLYILGSSDHGNYQAKLIIEYTDGTLQEEILSFSDWCQQPIFNENIVIDTKYRYNGIGIKENLNPKIYLNKFLLKNKKIKYIYLPKKPTMHIFAITIK